ncbi:hypothetical protein D3C80_2063900 [compost metagenome]
MRPSHAVVGFAVDLSEGVDVVNSALRRATGLGAHRFRHTYTGELPAAKIALVCIPDDPLFIANQCTDTEG